MLEFKKEHYVVQFEVVIKGKILLTCTHCGSVHEIPYDPGTPPVIAQTCHCKAFLKRPDKTWLIWANDTAELLTICIRRIINSFIMVKTRIHQVEGL